MSDRQGLEYLESLQRVRRDPTRLPRTPDRVIADIVAVPQEQFMRAYGRYGLTGEALATYLDDLHRMRDRIPTRYEHPSNYLLLSGLIDEIESALQGQADAIGPRPTFGTLDSGQVNATTLAVPGSTVRLVVFEGQLFIFILLITKIIVQLIRFRPGFEAPDVAAAIDADPRITRRFFDLVTAYAVDGHPGDAPGYPLPSESLVMNFALLVRAVNLFVVGHEYGHLIRGDLDHGAAARHVLPGAIVAEEISHSWRAEFAADEIGLRLSAIALNQLEVVLAGATVFLSGVGVMDRAVSLLRTGDENAQRIGSHPPSTGARDSSASIPGRPSRRSGGGGSSSWAPSSGRHRESVGSVPPRTGAAPRARRAGGSHVARRGVMAMAKVLVLDPEEADFVRRTAAEHDVTLDEVPAAGIEPVLTLTVVMIGTATAVAAVNDLVERRRGGQVIDLRPGATRVFFRSPDLIYGLVVVWAADGGAVYVEVKEPKGMFGQIVESLIGLLGDLAGAKSDAVAAAVAASLGPAVSVTYDGGAG